MPEKSREVPEAVRIAFAINALYASYKPEGVGLWLARHRPQLGGGTPLTLLSEGRVDEFCDLCYATGDMVGT